MTLKDYFAAAALTGYLSAGASAENAVVWSYRTAERMLEERAQNECYKNETDNFRYPYDKFGL
jgi:hypothetical protein